MAETLVTVQVGNERARVRRVLFDSEGHVALKEFLLTNGSWARYSEEYGFPDNSELGTEDRKVEDHSEEYARKATVLREKRDIGLAALIARGIAGVVKPMGEHYVMEECNCLLFQADKDYNAMFVCNLTELSVGHGILVFIPDEPGGLDLEKLDKAIDIMKEREPDLQLVSKRTRRMTQAVLP